MVESSSIHLVINIELLTFSELKIELWRLACQKFEKNAKNLNANLIILLQDTYAFN